MPGPSLRILRLLSLFQNRPRWTGPELAEHLDVTVRTIRRDIDRLRELGYPIDADLGMTGGYRLARGATLPPLMLDDDEAVAIAVCLRVAAGGSVAGLGEAAFGALRKLEQVLPARLRPRVAALASMTVPLAHGGRDGAGAVAADLLATIAQACRGSERLSFAYLDGHGHRSERIAEPYRLVSTGRRWYLAARDVRRGAWRTFRVDRMAGTAATGHRFVLHDPPDAAELVSRSISTAPYRHQARIQLQAPIAVAAEVVPPTVGTLEAIDDATTQLSTGANDLDLLALHLATLGMEFTVIEPEALRQRLEVLADRLRAGNRRADGGAHRPA